MHRPTDATLESRTRRPTFEFLELSCGRLRPQGALLTPPCSLVCNALMRSGRLIAQHDDHVEILVELNVALSALALRVIDFVGQGGVLVLFLHLAAGATKSF